MSTDAYWRPTTTADLRRVELVNALINGTLTDAERGHAAAMLRAVMSMLDAEDSDPGLDILNPREVEASRWRLVRDQVRDALYDYYAEGAP
jgi:hypothetical protein